MGLLKVPKQNIVTPKKIKGSRTIKIFLASLPV